MSLILDALRKMEQERKAKLGKRVDIRPEIMGGRTPRRKKDLRPFLIITGIVLVVAVSIAAGVLVKKKSTGTPEREEIFASEPPVPAPVPVQEAMPAPPPPAPVAPPIVAAPTPPRPTPMREEEPVLQASGQPELSVDGIAWQEERQARRAVVNGTLVGEGMTIAGAKVKMIKEDRVLFSYGGGTFEVSLASAPSASAASPGVPPISPASHPDE